MRRYAAPYFVVLATLLVFLPSVFHGWLNWDDGLMVAGNQFIRGFSWTNIRWAFTSSPTGAYQPLAYLTWMLDWSLWGNDPRGYHLVNVLLHALNSVLVFQVARRLLKLDETAAAFAALIFALHPLRVESVSWIAERRDTLSAAFWLGAVLAYLDKKKPLTYLLFTAACLAKGIAVTMPAVLWLVDVLLLGRPWRASAKDKLPMAALGVALGALAMNLQAGARASWSWSDHTLYARLAQSAYAHVFYAWKTVWPAGLSPFYEMRPPLNPREPRFFLSFVLVAFAAAAARRRPALLAAAGVYSVILLPVSGILQAGEQLVADRYSYLACLPFALLAAAALRGRRVLAGLVVAALAVATVAQQAHWKNSQTLWTRALALDPVSPTALVNYGTALVDAGRVREAGTVFERALEADPVCLPAQGDPAILETRPACRKALNNLGAARAQLGEYAEAKIMLKLAIRADPSNEGAKRNLARVEAYLRR